VHHNGAPKIESAILSFQATACGVSLTLFCAIILLIEKVISA
jgi:hypothetical protein